MLTSAHICFIPLLLVWTIELVLAFVTIDALGIMLTALADATTLIATMDVQR